MTPTSFRTLLLAVLGAGLLGWLLFDTSYSSIQRLPYYAIAVAAVMAVFELGLAKVVRDKLRAPGKGRPMHPLQVARAAVLAKASSLGGALALGLYAGFFTWSLPRRDIDAASDDALVAGLSGLACLLLVGAALLLERSCRTPKQPQD